MTTIASQDELAQILSSLKGTGVKNVALTTVEGRTLGSTIAESGPRFKLGALSAASFAIAMKTGGELALGDLDQVQILCGDGALLLCPVGRKALLSAVADKRADPLALMREMRRVALQLSVMV